MDWMRRCFTSKFRLHRDSDELTEGRWYFAPKGTPHYPGQHNLGSRDWTSSEREKWPALGEYEGEREWSNGMPPRPLPLPILVGSADCLAAGETGPDEAPEVEPDNTCNAYPAACYGKFQRQVAAYDISCCETQRAFALCLEAQYNDDDYALTYLQNYLGPGFSYTKTPNSASYVPGTIIAVGRVVVCVISGTTNWQQAALYGLYQQGGPTDYGAYRTNPVWMGAAREIEDRIRAAGWSTQTEFYFVGHSYGGAVSCILATRMALARPNFFVNLLTFAAPVAGNQQMRDILGSVRQLHLIVPGDPVPGLPPRSFDLISLTLPVTALWRFGWAQMIPQQNRALLYPGGQIVDSEDQYLEYSVLSSISDIIAAAGTMPVFNDHFMSTYASRLRLACQGPLPPYVVQDPLRVRLTLPRMEFMGQVFTPTFDALCYNIGIGWQGVDNDLPAPYFGKAAFLLPVFNLDMNGNPVGDPIGLEVYIWISVNIGGFPTAFELIGQVYPYAFWIRGKDKFTFPLDAFGPPDLPPLEPGPPLYNVFTYQGLDIEPL